MKPLLKWPGGKRYLVAKLAEFLPRKYGNYYEPFFGGGAAFFGIQPRKAVLSDLDEDLMNCYSQVRNRPNEIISGLMTYQNSEKEYYKIRGWQPKGKLERASRLIYLLTLSFNGIYRLNLRGEFNVPYGYKTHLKVCEPEKIMMASKVLIDAKLLNVDFERATKAASCGDVVYFDPPYTLAHKNNGFIKYNKQLFEWTDQVRLATVAQGLSKRGCKVIVTNADHPSIQELYPAFQRIVLTRPSIIASKSNFRRDVTECIYFNDPMAITE